jgi:hypothetical protein
MVSVTMIPEAVVSVVIPVRLPVLVTLERIEVAMVGLSSSAAAETVIEGIDAKVDEISFEVCLTELTPLTVAEVERLVDVICGAAKTEDARLEPRTDVVIAEEDCAGRTVAAAEDFWSGTIGEEL